MHGLLKKEGLLLPLGEIKTLHGCEGQAQTPSLSVTSITIPTKIILVFDYIPSFKCFLRRSNRLCELLNC